MSRLPWFVAAAFSLTSSLAAQTPAIDSAGIASAITQYILTVPTAEPRALKQRPFVIDTVHGGWNALEARQLAATQTPLLRSLTDSEAYFALHFSVGRVDVSGDTATVLLWWNTCHQDQPTSRGYEENGEARTTVLARNGTAWAPAIQAKPSNALIGHGWCPPYRAHGGH